APRAPLQAGSMPGCPSVSFPRGSHRIPLRSICPYRNRPRLLALSLGRRNDREQDMGGVGGGVEDLLEGDAGGGIVGDGVAGVEVAVEAGEVAAADLEADAMARFEEVRGDPAVDLELGDLAGSEELGGSPAVAVATPD